MLYAGGLTELDCVSITAEMLSGWYFLEQGRLDRFGPRLHSNMIFNVCWNRNSSVIGTTYKDKKVRVIDPRKEKVVAEMIPTKVECLLRMELTCLQDGSGRLRWFWIVLR
ncbi:uncharacterized protein LOC144825032 [Lissotriton helveticus]